MIEEMGKVDFNYYFDRLVDWIKVEEDFRILYSVSGLVEHFADKNMDAKPKLEELNALFKERLESIDKNKFS